MHYTVQLYCTLYRKVESSVSRRQQRRRKSQESETMPYKHVNEVVKKRCVKHKSKRWDSRATLLLIATSVGALVIYLIIKQINTNIVNQTNKLNDKIVHSSFCFSISLATEVLHLIILKDIYKLCICYEFRKVPSMKCVFKFS